MTQGDVERAEERLKERMDAGDKANRDRIDQLYIDRSEDVEDRRAFRKEMHEDHQAVLVAIKGIQDAVTPLPGLVKQVEELVEWKAKHNEHHGKDDNAIATRIGADNERKRLANFGLDTLKVATGAVGACVLGVVLWLLDKL